MAITLMARRVVQALLLSSVDTAVFAQVRVSSMPSRVRIDAGALEGTVDSTGVLVFRGIPYAAAPVGALRWRAPHPVSPWHGVRPASTYGASCPQPGDSTEWGPTSEDCLTLNVYTATLPVRNGRRSHARPVMVWIHGGGYFTGSARGYDGQVLARKGAVVVTLNYRLGALGYLAHPALIAESPSTRAGNYGLLDQIAALQWVKRNISRFGGDPARVTIFGESAGAFSVGALLASPNATGYFHRAILQSGTGLGFGILTPAAARDYAQAGAKALGILGEDAAAARALRSVATERLMEIYSPAPSVTLPYATWSGPVAGGEGLPLTLDGAITTGRWNRVPIIVGSNAGEGVIFQPIDAARTPEAFRALLNGAEYGDPTGSLARAYPMTTHPDSAELAHLAQRVTGDRAFGAPARALARLAARRGAPAYLYYFARVTHDSAGRQEDALHTAEIPFSFGMLSEVWSPFAGLRQGPAPNDGTLADAMSDYWVAFAASGDPNGAPARGKWPRWPPHNAHGDTYLEFGAVIAAKRGLRKAQYDAFDALARARGELRR